MDKKKNILTKIKKVQDDDGHWYWIPNKILTQFKNDLNQIGGKMYMDWPEKFDAFADKYDKYRTLGDSDNMPNIFDE